jgi:sec-independent protein translocase protein TatB
MDFLSVGPFELILILIVFFIFVGPAKLPEIAGMIGKGMRKFREASAELNRGLKDMADEVKEAGSELGKDVGETAKPGTGLTKDLQEVSREIQGMVREAGDSVKSATRPTRSAATRIPKEASDKSKQTGAAMDPEQKETARKQRSEEEA